MEAFVLFVLVLLAVVNVVLAISTSIVLAKVFEVVKMQQYTQELKEKATIQARGLLDIDTPQVPYSLRR